jgi:hypothetical protein
MRLYIPCSYNIICYIFAHKISFIIIKSKKLLLLLLFFKDEFRFFLLGYAKFSLE